MTPRVGSAFVKRSVTGGDRLTAKQVFLFLKGLSMANKTDKWPHNIGGKFFVDQQCIDCDLCRETAPSFFTRHDEGGYSFVHKQPTTEDEIAQCMEALEGCPVEAIGNDGEP
ncbi:MAG: hypothetical protein RL077_2023 [Verrucomicrobiota bacterium]|jgi:ferredoxin